MIEDDDGNAIEPDMHWLVWSAMIATIPLLLAIGVFASISNRDLMVAATRVAFGGVGLALSTLMPTEMLTSVVAFCGKMFVFLAVYGLLVPLEGKITGGLVDALMRPRP